MPTVIASDKFQSLLQELKERAEIRTTEGRLLGYFMPIVQDETRLYEHAKSLFDPAEMARREASVPSGYSIQQVMAHLGNLEAKS